jgi:hypothetical protein
MELTHPSSRPGVSVSLSAGIYISQLSSCSGAESTRALTVDGRPLPAHSWSKVKLRPGQIVDFGEESFQVFRQVEAHA